MERRKIKKEINYKKRVSYVVYASIAAIAFIVIIFTGVLTERASETIRLSSARLISADCTQLQLNINSYFQKVESNAALLFSSADYYKYDKTDESISTYDRLVKENNLLNRIVDLGIMENYSDFVIIYSNNTNVGWLSNNTKDQFKGQDMYSILSSYINREKTKDGWFDGINGYYDRIYYVKRINNNAVLLVSFYSRELEGVFSIPNELQNMNVRLIDDSNSILYSSDKSEIGSHLPDEFDKIMNKNVDFSYSDSEKVINVASCNNGWRVVCEMSMDEVLKDINNMRRFTYIFGGIIIIIFAVFIIITMRRISHPIDRTINDLQMNAQSDGLTGLLNKIAFEDKVVSLLPERNNIAFVMLDMDRFKNVNDTKGHIYGDEVIVRMASVLKSSLRESTIIGRLGGDEFAFMFDDNNYDVDSLRTIVISRVEDIKRAFDKEFFIEKEELKISLSFGIVAQKYSNEDFTTIYSYADKALYMSKENGRDTYTIYEENMEVERK